MQRVDRIDPDENAAQRRLIFALTLSALLHGIVLWVAPGSSGQQTDAPDALAQSVAPRMFDLSVRLHRGTTFSDADAEPVPSPARWDALGRVNSPDPRYYRVAELDVLPTPRQPLPLGHDLLAPPQRVRLLTQIDASGRVTGITVFETSAGEARTLAAQKALREAGFNAARKDGRPVRSEVLIELLVGSGEDQASTAEYAE